MICGARILEVGIMKKSVSLLIATILVFALAGCNRSMNYIIENEPSVVGIVTQIDDRSMLIHGQPMEGYPYEWDCRVSLDVENEDSCTGISIGDEVVVYYDGSIAESDPMQISTVYAITLKTPANRTENTETVSFHDKTFNKADLSQETLEWLERYNGLTEAEQLSISSIPADLYELCGYGDAGETVAE